MGDAASPSTDTGRSPSTNSHCGRHRCLLAVFWVRATSNTPQVIGAEGGAESALADTPDLRGIGGMSSTHLATSPNRLPRGVVMETLHLPGSLSPNVLLRRRTLRERVVVLLVTGTRLFEVLSHIRLIFHHLHMAVGTRLLLLLAVLGRGVDRRYTSQKTAHQYDRRYQDLDWTHLFSSGAKLIRWL